uniref:NADH dehydrogenase [ubiquinone] iron-sulfur protein 4, mitochondrial n=1 Tax=Ditylenchus dipsaci TaxID=166011 RepID=A0A915E6E8_9BILA
MIGIPQTACYSLSSANKIESSYIPGGDQSGKGNLSQGDPNYTGAGKSIEIYLSAAQRKTLEEALGEVEDVNLIVLEGDQTKDVIELSGHPEEHQEARRVRIYQPARATPQSGWNNTGFWKIEFDNRERWENMNIGWCSSADPLSNVSMALSFATKEDAMIFCKKNRWTYEVEEPPVRKITPKAYGSNFHWSKRTRVSTKNICSLAILTNALFS